jgi:short-subunit dehydrogenase
MQFKDRVALVTGAANGIGRSLCFRMGREGASIGLVDRNGPGLAQLGAELDAAGIRHAAATADVRSRDDIRAASAAVAAALGAIDILVASAGVGGVSGVDDLKVAELELILQVNFLGVVYAIEAVLPDMLRRKRGQIVGIASLAAFRAIPFESAYCASKAAVAAYLEGLRPALRRRGVIVTTVFPGFVRTALLDGILAATGAPVPRDTMDLEPAAERIITAIRRDRRIACFPWTTTLLARGGRVLPAAVYDWVMTRLASSATMRY